MKAACLILAATVANLALMGACAWVFVGLSYAMIKGR